VSDLACERQKEQLTIMTKAELLEAVAKRAGVTKTDADKVLDAFSLQTLGRQWP
jgi:Bacterial DNA-binding protein